MTLRLRSPAYPSMNLADAVEKLKQLYRAQKYNPVNVDIAITTLGFTSLGHGGRCIAAMKMFGLIEDEGKNDERIVAITELGKTILRYPEDDPDHKDAIKTAAQSPSIYADMLSQWPESLPTDSQIRKWLIGRKFNEEYIKPLIDNFRDTYEYANLAQRGTLEEENHTESSTNVKTEERVEKEQSIQIQPQVAPGINLLPQPITSFYGAGSTQMPTMIGAFSLPIPLPRRRFAILQTPSDLSPAEYDRIKLFLENNRDVVLDDLDEENSNSEQDLQHGD